MSLSRNPKLHRLLVYGLDPSHESPGRPETERQRSDPRPGRDPGATGPAGKAWLWLRGSSFPEAWRAGREVTTKLGRPGCPGPPQDGFRACLSPQRRARVTVGLSTALEEGLGLESGWTTSRAGGTTAVLVHVRACVCQEHPGEDVCVGLK